MSKNEKKKKIPAETVGHPPTHLVRRGVLAKPDVAVDAEDDVLDRQLGDGLVGLGDALRQRRDEGLPVLEGSAILRIVGCKPRQYRSPFHTVHYLFLM